jgi:FkbM family methyltransferase
MNCAAVDLTLGRTTRPFAFRAGTSDETIIQQIFQRGEYELRGWSRTADLLEYGTRRMAGGLSPLIVDAGANIGAASVFFALFHPGSQIVAIEPEAENFALLTRNGEGLAIDCRHAALASTAGHVELIDPGLGPWAYRTSQPVAGPGLGQRIETVTMDEIYAARAATHFPFIAKIDIEGAEAELFSRNLDWVAATPLIIIELHDWMMPKQGTARSFLKCVAAQDRDFVYFGENVLSLRNQL